MATTMDSSATQKINDFERSSGDTDWIKVKKDVLVRGLKDRVKNPDHINTSQLELCGPGLFFYFLARDKPASYVQIVIDLWRNNTALLGTRKITAPYDLRISAIPAGVDPVDWVPLTSLRTDENIYLTANDGIGLDSLTMPSAVVKWLGQAGYTDAKNVTNVLFTKGMDEIKKADELRGQGYRVGLFINTNMMYATSQDHRSVIPNHWISLEDAFKVDGNGNVSTTVWCWGQNWAIPQGGTLSTTGFFRNFYGYIAAKPPA
jgi:hypothetical protein